MTDSPLAEDDDGFLTKMSVKLPSVGGVVSIGDVYNSKITNKNQIKFFFSVKWFDFISF